MKWVNSNVYLSLPRVNMEAMGGSTRMCLIPIYSAARTTTQKVLQFRTPKQSVWVGDGSKSHLMARTICVGSADLGWNPSLVT